MKRLILYISFPALLLTACSKDFLAVAPKSSLTTGNFYETEAQFQQALMGAYAAIRSGITGQSGWIMGEMRSDNTFFDFNPTDRGEPFLEEEAIDEFLENSSNTWVASEYDNCYIGISRANAIIDRISSADLDSATVRSIVGQARFLRGLFYFDLVRYFGDVPLYLHQVSGVGDAYLQRASSKDVYAAILQDAQYAMETLPAPEFPQNGAATKGSAAMLLAYTDMTQGDYASAETLLKSITQMGYELLPDYASVFDPANKNSKESIFEAQYQQGNQGQNSAFIYYFMPIADDYPITGLEGYNRNGGWNIPTQEMINSYEPGDQRLDASVGIAIGTGSTGNFTIDTVENPDSYIPVPGTLAKPFVKKYLHPHSVFGNTDDDFPIYRYSDALLLLAEALNEQGKSTEALSYLNMVRARAGLPAATETNQALLQDVIVHERRVELAFENKRWFDLVREGTAIDVMTADGAYLKSIDPLMPANGYEVTQSKLLFPIPLREIQIGSLQQNPGY